MSLISIKFLLYPTPWVSMTVIVLIAAIITGLSAWQYRRCRIQDKGRGNWHALLVSLAILILLSEGLFRCFDIGKTYNEKRNGVYRSAWSGGGDWFFTWEANSSHLLQNEEFTYSRVTNALGLSDREWLPGKQDSLLRILALGDSFTEGDGSPYDSTWVRLFGHLAEKEGISVEVMNAGVCGSDPYFSYMLLKEKLLVYEPDVVILCVSSQDMLEDFRVRGGLERFQDNGGLRYNRPPAWESVYAYSYLFRLFVHSLGGRTELLLKKKEKTETKKQYLKEFFSLLERYRSLSTEYAFVFHTIYFPLKVEVEKKEYLMPVLLEDMLPEKIGEAGLHFVLADYLDYILEEGGHPDDYWWARDGHHNSRGYQMMASCIYNRLSDTLDQMTNRRIEKALVRP